MDWIDGDGDDGATTIFSTARRKFRNEATRWGLPVLDVEVGEDDGDVGYLLVPSAWTEELHGELSTAARPAELRETEGKLGRERGGGAREEWRGRARVWRRRGVLVGARGQVERGPRRWWRAVPSPFGEDDGNEGRGGTGRSEREERERGGWAARALRG